MTDRKPPVSKRVDSIEARVDRLERLTVRVRRDQRATFKQIQELRDTVAAFPATIGRALDSQTDEIRVVVAESETRNADRIAAVARQWPAGAIVLATAALAIVTDLVLAAAGLPHLS